MEKRKKKEILAVLGCTIIAMLVVITTIFGLTKIPPNFDKLSDEKVLRYTMSGKIENLNSEQLSKLGERFEKIPFEKRREAMNGLTDEERNNLRRNRRLIAEAALTKTINEFFSLPADRQDEFLDKQIEQMNERMQEFRQRFRTAREMGGSSPNFPMRGTQQGERRQSFEGGRDGENAGERREARLGTRGSMSRRPSPEAVLQRRRDRLSEVTPEDRAKRRKVRGNKKELRLNLQKLLLQFLGN